MYKRIMRTLVTLAGVGLAGAAGATPVSFSQTFNPSDVFFRDTGEAAPYSFSYDIRGEGFNPLTDTLTGLSLNLRFRDNGDSGAEAVTIGFDNAPGNDFTIRSGSCNCRPTVILQDLATGLMQQDGILNLTLDRRLGDFWFMDATLVANADRGVISGGDGEVPEPATGLLTGLALLGAGLVRRRRPGQ